MFYSEANNHVTLKWTYIIHVQQIPEINISTFRIRLLEQSVFFIKLLRTRWNCFAWLHIFALMLTKEVIWNEQSVQWPALPDSLPWSLAMLFPALLPFWNDDWIKVKRFIGIIFQVNSNMDAVNNSTTLYFTLPKLNLKFGWTNNLFSKTILGDFWYLIINVYLPS